MDLEAQVQDQIARNILWNAEDQVDQDRSDMEVVSSDRLLFFVASSFLRLTFLFLSSFLLCSGLSRTPVSPRILPLQASHRTSSRLFLTSFPFSFTEGEPGHEITSRSVLPQPIYNAAFAERIGSDEYRVFPTAQINDEAEQRRRTLAGKGKQREVVNAEEPPCSQEVSRVLAKPKRGEGDLGHAMKDSGNKLNLLVSSFWVSLLPFVSLVASSGNLKLTSFLRASPFLSC